MPNIKNTSSDKPVGNDNDSTRKKRPTLTQKVKEQALRIDELNTQLQQKEQELKALTSQTHIIEDLSHKLQVTEQAMKAVSTKAESRALKVDELTTQLKEKQSAISTTLEQAALIDKLSNKLQEVEIKLTAVSINNKHNLAQNTVKAHMIAGISLGLLPAPLFDIAALTGTQLNLLRSLSQQYDVDFDEKTGKVMLTSLLSGALPVLTIVGLSSLVKIIPGIGTIGGSISMSALSGAVIFATGQVFIRHFEAGGTFQNFDSKHWKAFFKKQFEKGKKTIRNKYDMPKTSTT